MILVDSGAWFALYVPNDKHHQAANAWRHSNDQQLVTTDYLVTETLNLFVARRETQRARRLGESLLSGSAARLVRVTPEDIDSAWNVFRRYVDKEWSFTDCVSFVVMERLGLRTAFAFDDHFRQHGGFTVVPHVSAAA